MSDELNLTLPEKKQKNGKMPWWIPVLLGLILIACLLQLVLPHFHGGGSVDLPAGSLSPEERRDIALKLEKQELGGEAVWAWREYLASSDLDTGSRAKIWYRMGKLLQDEGRFGEALDAFYRCESHGAPEELEPEIARRVQECLQRLGKLTSLSYELKDRTGLEEGGDPEGSKVLAEIGPRKITQADLDHHLEYLVELQMEQFASFMPPDEQVRQKEAILQQLSAPDARRAELQRYVMEEVLFRQAREDGLHEDPGMRNLLMAMERQLLAETAMRKELGSEIKITDTDLTTYYEANKERFVEKKEDGSPGRQLSFDEARPEVYRALRLQKERDVQENLLLRLKEKYDVVIHQDALGVREQASGQEDDGRVIPR